MKGDDYIGRRGVKVTTANRLGEIRNNNSGTPMKIIAYRTADDIDVEFLDDHHYIKEHNNYHNFKVGGIKNPYDKDLYGVGYIGVGNYMAFDNGKMSAQYRAWSGMLERCYSYPKKYPAYVPCVVCDEWHDYQVCAEWFDENKYTVNERLHIDKDILFPNCNLYSPPTCLLVPQRINMLFMNKPNDRGLPNGIRFTNSGRYSAKYNGKDIGTYDTLEEAYANYAKAKEKKIKEVADEYKGIIPKKVYEALYDYKVDIRNDKNYKAA